jgi:ribokinase
MFDVITIGSATVDVFANTNRVDLIRITTPTSKNDLIAYPSGDKVLLNTLIFTTGGGGTNCAVALSRLGLKTAFLGKIGQRANSRYVLEVLKKEKVNSSNVCREKSRTGFSVILDAKGSDRTILAFKGSNNDLTEKEINFKKLKTKWFYFSSMMEKSFETQKTIARYAEKNKIKIAYNPSSYLTEKGPGPIKEILLRTEILILNKHEAKLLVGKASMPLLLKKINELGPKNVIITDGKKGAACLYEGKIYRVFTRRVKVKETTGAGDSFAATFLGVIIKKKDPKLALRMATLNAQSVVQYIGAKKGLLTWSELRKRLKGWCPKLIENR